MSSTTCTKCFAASEKCTKAKDNLKVSKTEVKKMEKDLMKTEKELKTSRQKIAELRQKQECRSKVLEKLEEMKKQMAALEQDNETVTGENKMLQEQVDALIATRPLPKKERSWVIIDLKDKIFEVNTGKVYSNADEKIFMLMHKSTDPEIKKLAHLEQFNFREKHDIYEKALKSTLATIQANEHISRSEIPSLPDYPTLSDRFNEAYEKEMKKELPECLICLEEMDVTKEDELFKCPQCKKLTHSECIDNWFQRNPSCPNCRDEWK